MVYNKTRIFNLTLGVLLLSRQVIDADTDTSREAKVLNQFWDAALESALADMDLDSTSTSATLELLASEPNDLWYYAYKYPANCSLFRRIQSGQRVDNRTSFIEKRIGIYDGKKAIFTNQENAVGEFISSDALITNASAAMAIAYKLAWYSAPLVVGKGSKSLRESLVQDFIAAKADAQRIDTTETWSPEDEQTSSEFVEERMS